MRLSKPTLPEAYAKRHIFRSLRSPLIAEDWIAEHFRAYTPRYGKAIPEENWDNETWRQYNEWRYECIAEWNSKVQAAKNRVRPPCAWMPLSQVAESRDHSRVGGWDLDYTQPFQDGIVLEAQRRYARVFGRGSKRATCAALHRKKVAA